jgi:hypothetical protein
MALESESVWRPKQESALKMVQKLNPLLASRLRHRAELQLPGSISRCHTEY